jgi:ABC-type nitrate/sulfonate/bicarbonate transport system substrate-binding protein
LLTRAVALVAAALAGAGCGGGGGSSGTGTTTLVLDFTPNAVHAGIYSAVARGYDRAAGVRLDVRQPSSSTDSVKLLLSRRVDFAVLDIHDLAIARAAGRDVVGVLPLVQRPLAAVLAQPDVRTPRDLAGRLAGVSGLPSDDAVLRSVVAGAGGDPRRVREVTIGFDAVPALLGGHVAAATAFWDVEGVALRRRRPGIREFRVDDYGAPAYPELVLTVTRQTLQDSPSLVRATIAALSRGYSEVLADPESGVSALVTAVPGLKQEEVQRELDAVSPSFREGVPAFGVLSRTRLQAWARWELKFGLVKKLPDVSRAFDGRYVPPDGRD